MDQLSGHALRSRIGYPPLGKTNAAEDGEIQKKDESQRVNFHGFLYLQKFIKLRSEVSLHAT